MPFPYEVRVRVHSVSEGECPQGFKVGDSWTIKSGLIAGGKTPGGMCVSAYQVVGPVIRDFRFGAEHPYDDDKDITYISCPDPNRRVIYEIRRIR